MDTQTLRRPVAGQRVHFVGIGGAGMAALAELLLHLGYEVSGSDLKDSRAVRRLQQLGARVTVGPHRAELVEGAECVVLSAAVPGTNPEVRRAVERGAEVLLRSELLARIFNAGRGVAVAGTHGKTTTSSMVARALEAAGLSPTFVVGGDLNDVGSGAGLGSGDVVVAEADEAYGSFALLRPEVAVVTNVDADHLDYYPDQSAIDEAFAAFLDGRKAGGVAVLCAEDEGVARLRPRVQEPVVTYGLGGADLALEAKKDAWRVRWQGREVGRLRPSVPGFHNLLNAAGAAAAAFVLGAEPTPVLEALASFSGVDRRFSVRGRAGGVTVVDDYAHNPGKVAACLAAAREAFGAARLVVLFQPHLYSRTRMLAAAFGPAFREADVVVVTDVYGAREDPEPGVSGRLICDAIRQAGGQAIYVPRLEDAAGVAAGLAEAGDVVLTMGAGDVTTAAPRILRLLEER